MLSTANHHLPGAVGAAVVVAVAVAAARKLTGEPGQVATGDEFFLHVEDGANAQNVGGYVILDPAADAPLSWEAIRDLLRDNLAGHPRFTSRIDSGRGRPRWVPVDDVSWDEHVVRIDLPPGADRAALDEVVARFHAQRLPRDRPLWRCAIIHGLPDGRAAFVILLHHSMADGIGGIAQLLALVRPTITLPVPERRRPGRLAAAGGILTGIGQLATDGMPSAVLDPGGARTALSTLQLDFAQVRQLARRHGVTVTQLVLALTGTAVAASDPVLAARCDHRLRVSVPVMLQVPGSGDQGNSTAAVIIDTPARDVPLAGILPEVAAAARPLRSPTRALASHWVMARALQVAPRAARRAFARAVYGRRFFHGIVSNIPGPPGGRLTLAGAGMAEVYPLLPPAPGAPITVGAMTWERQFCILVTTDPDVLDPREVTARMRKAYDSARSLTAASAT